MSSSGETELIKLQEIADLPYHWSAGKYGSKFLRSLRDEKKFWGTRCPQCEKVYFPPREVCGPCFAHIEEWVELPTEGTLTAFSVVNFPFIDPELGDKRPVPYTFGYIQLDGCDTAMSHFVNEHDHTKLWRGMRVEAVFKEDGQREGNMQDVLYFEIKENQ